MPEPRYPQLRDLPETSKRRLAKLSLLAAIALTPRCGAMPYVSSPYDYNPPYDTSSPEESRGQDLYSKPKDTSSDDLVYRPDVRASDSEDVLSPDIGSSDTPRGDDKSDSDAADASADGSLEADALKSDNQAE